MYRPGMDPHFRPRDMPVPPPPQGLMNYVSPSSVPSHAHGQPFTAPQFSFVSAQPPPPIMSHGPSFSASVVPVPPVPAGIHAPSFVPPLPSDLPPPPPPLSPPPPSSPPPPLSPPPSPPPPPLPCEDIPLPNCLPEKLIEDQKKYAAGRSSSEVHIPSTKEAYRVPEVGDESLRKLASETDATNRQRHSDWNSTYQDTLNDEEGSPALSDMDMDTEDAGQVNVRRTGVSVEGNLAPKELNQDPYRNVRKYNFQNLSPGKERVGKTDDRHQPIKMQMKISDDKHDPNQKEHVESKSQAHIFPSKSLDKPALFFERQADDSLSLLSAKNRVAHEISSSSGAEKISTPSAYCQRGKPSRWGSPPTLQSEQVVDKGHLAQKFQSSNLTVESLKDYDKDHKRSDPSAVYEGLGTTLNPEEQSIIGKSTEFSPGLPTTGKMQSIASAFIAADSSYLEKQKKQPIVDEFGRLAHDDESDIEPDLRVEHPQIDEFGRLARRDGSESESEKVRHPLKRKRSYSRSRSRSTSSRSRERSYNRNQSRSRGRIRDQDRSGSHSRSQSRSRSRRQSSRSRSYSRSESENRSRSRSRSRSSSRSRSRSRSSEWRRRSHSRSPRRKMRWSRSRSRSPRRRSYSRTPPRDMRWSSMGRGDRDWRADREYFGRGRRGGRGGGPNPCFYYARGRCLKGSSCRYLHVDREASGNERSSWRRDIQSERFTSDTVLEDHTAEHTRGQWITDSQVDRQDEFGPSAQQDHVVENQKQDSTASFNVPQEEIGQEPPFKAVTHFPQEELWATKNTSEDREVMAYNKALELVGLFPKESVNTKAKPIHNIARVEAKSDAMSFTNKASVPDESKFRFSEFPRKSTLMQSSEYAQETHTLGGAPPNRLVDTSHNEFNGEVTYDGVKEVQPSAIRKEAAVLQGLRMNEHDERLTENTRVLEEVKTMGEDNVKELFGQNNIPVSMLSGDQNVGNAQENSVVVGVEGTAKCPGTDVAGSSLNMSLEASDLISMRTEIMGKTIHFDSNASAEVNTMESSKEETKTGLSCKAETSSDSAENNKVPNLIERIQSPLDEEASRKMEIKPMNELEAANVSKTSYSGDEERVYKEIEGELHASAALVAGGQASAPEAKSVPLTSCTQLGQQHILTGQQTPGILPLPADVQRQISTCQPLSVTGISFPPLFQGQNRPPMGQIYPQNHPSSSMQYPSFAADIRGTYRPPLNRPLMMPQPLDQGAHPIGKLTSENTGYPSSGGWGQQQLTSGPLLRGPEGRGVSSRQSHIPSTSGSYYGPPSHGSSFPVDQFPQHQQASYPASQFTQLPRPANPEGFGQSHSSNPGGFQSLSSVPVQSKPSGAFMQPNSGASLPQQQNIASSAGLYPSQPPQSYRPSDPRQMFMSHTASQNYGQLNQSAFSSAFPVRPINQNLPASGQQPGQTNQFINQSMSLPFTQSQPTKVTFSLTDSFIPEQSQPFQLSSDIATKQLSAMSAEFLSQPATLSPLPSQNNPAWTFQGSRTSVTPSTGQSTIYSYSLTAIPPLSGMVQDPKPISSSVRKDQLDPLYDGTGSGLSGGSKMGMMNSVPEARILGDGAKTDLAVGTENHSLDLDTHRSSIPASTKQSEIDVKATAEDIGVVENVSPENWSPGQPTDVAEADKDQALSKKSNRGLKMLRAAIADHVKEVLKPTWKEGYMSKEAFKTIAKKAVEKVIGNVPTHHIPKSQEKVDQYMKAARPKISKLVQGYVDKYLKL